MNALYVTSVEAYSGKTALCLALGKQMQADGYDVGYLKPVSTQPWRTPDGDLADEDAAFVKANLQLDMPAPRLSPVIVTPSSLRDHLKGTVRDNLLETIREAADEALDEKDALLLEGGASLRQGYSIGLSNLRVADNLGAPALVIVKYRGEMELVDDALTAQFRLGDQLLGVILNQVRDEDMPFVEDYARPFLEEEGIRVLGVLPLRPRLAALSVQELVALLDAEVLTETLDPDRLVETFTVGAMTADKALSRFRRYPNKAVITGGDRTDIQLAALETSTSALILTGNLRPSPLIIQQADSLGVVTLLVPDNTMETVEVVERAYGKTRLGQPEKMDAFRSLMAECVDLSTIYESLGLG